MNILPSLRLPHVAARVEDGRVVVEVWDFELWDLHRLDPVEVERVFRVNNPG